MKKVFFLLFAFSILACGRPEPRKPVQVKSGSFFKESVERSKKLLAEEEALIQNSIANDSLNTYFSNPNGFWYRYEVKSDTATYHLKTDDEILLLYNMMSFANDTIYSSDDIGIVQHAIDKSQLFPGLRNAIKVLKEGERATFLFPSSQAYGYKGDGNKIGASIPIKSSVTLLKILKKKDSLN